MSTGEPINAVATAFRVIEQLSDAREPLGASELARRMGTGRALVFRHLRTLSALGYVMQDPDTDRYALTAYFARLGQDVGAAAGFIEAVRGVVSELSRATGLTVSVGQPERDGIRVVDIVRNRAKIEISTPIGTLFEYASSAQGQAVLSFDPTFCAEPSITQETAARIRSRGWSVVLDEVLWGRLPRLSLTQVGELRER